MSSTTISERRMNNLQVNSKSEIRNAKRDYRISDFELRIEAGPAIFALGLFSRL